ncbi:MAG: hypothetical protein IV107_12990 [Paucibacter sp.]|nr:hypothetical protein [Roseateles sp.]
MNVDIEKLARLVVSALGNERAIDLRYRDSRGMTTAEADLPNYKLMKQIALKRRFGFLYSLIIPFAPLAIFATFPFQWALALLGSLGYQSMQTRDICCRLLVTTPQNIDLIDSALLSDNNVSHLKKIKLDFTCFSFGRQLGRLAVLRCIHTHIRLICMLRKTPAGARRDIILHARDSLALIMLGYSALSCSDIFVTDDHYQRWSFVLSHASDRFQIVQHGFLDQDICFPHPFGTVETLFIRDAIFFENFDRIYKVSSSKIFKPGTGFELTKCSEGALFLASSFPAIDSELEFISKVKAEENIPLIIKFHPAHTYDGRKAQLAALADFVYEGHGNPACRFFASYNSFMEFDYSSAYIPTISILRAGGAEAAFTQLRQLLKSSHPFS